MLTLKDKSALGCKDEKERNPKLMKSIDKSQKVKKSSRETESGLCPGRDAIGDRSWASVNLKGARKGSLLLENRSKAEPWETDI